ncbi:MAG: helix-turn-helix domain-containing protein [Spirochaetales bacterium]|nr:helix-turn-helix domain-containing protein [Spirochaetales bacterium]
MSNEKDIFDLIIHPDRFKILRILKSRPMTPSNLRKNFTNLSRASFYRQLKQLEDAQLIEICKKEQKRGTIENTFRISDNFVKNSSYLLEKISKEEYIKIFSIFLIELLSDLETFIDEIEYKSELNSILFEREKINISEANRDEFINEYHKLVSKYSSDKEIDSKTITTIILPKQSSNII